MPLHDILEDTFRSTLNHIPMTRNDSLKIPSVDPVHTLVEARPVFRARGIPQEPLLPLRLPSRTHQPHKQLRQQARLRPLLCPGILLRRRQVEHQIRLNKRLIGLVKEHQLLVPMATHILIVEGCVEVGVDFETCLILLRPYVLEICPSGFLRGLPFLR